MISIITGLFGLAGWGGGILGLAGVALKVLGKVAPAAASSILSNPITAAVAKVAEGFVDLIVWAIKAVLTYLGSRIASALDHIFSNGFAGVVFIASLVLAYEVGGWGKAQAHPEPKSPSVTRSAPATPTPKSTSSFDPFDWIEQQFR